VAAAALAMMMMMMTYWISWARNLCNKKLRLEFNSQWNLQYVSFDKKFYDRSLSKHGLCELSPP
jgi:hypothetical protein